MTGGRFLELARETSIGISTHAAERFSQRSELPAGACEALFRGAEKVNFVDLQVRGYWQQSASRAHSTYFITTVGKLELVFVLLDQLRAEPEKECNPRYLLITVVVGRGNKQPGNFCVL